MRKSYPTPQPAPGSPIELRSGHLRPLVSGQMGRFPAELSHQEGEEAPPSPAISTGQQSLKVDTAFIVVIPGSKITCDIYYSF